MGRIVVDPYYVQSPIGEGIAAIGKALVSGPSAYENAYYQAKTGNTNLESEKLRRSFAGQDETATLVGQQGYDPDTIAKVRAAWVRSGGDVSKLGDLIRTTVYTQGGAPRPARDSAFMGAGGTASGTETGHDQTLANAIQRVGMEQAGENSRNAARISSTEGIERDRDARAVLPVVLPGATPDGAPMLAMRPKSEVANPAFAGTPVLPGNLYGHVAGPNGTTLLQPNAPGLQTRPSGGSLHNYMTPTGQEGATTDGLTDLHTGAPLPPGSKMATAVTPDVGNAEMNQLRTSNQNIDLMNKTIGDILDAIKKSPATMGATGGARELVQNLLQQGQMAGGVLGIDIGKVREQVSKVDPSLGQFFDPALPQVDQMLNLLAYQYASEMYGQSGRGLNKSEFLNARRAVGGEGLLGNPEEFAARAFTTQNQLQRKKAANDERLKSRGPQAAPATGGSPGILRYDMDSGTLR